MENESWEDRYRKHVAAALSRLPFSVVKADEEFDNEDDPDKVTWRSVSFYGWHDWEAAMHMDECGISISSPDFEEMTFSQFEGTFEENSTVRIDAIHRVPCRCGKYRKSLTWEMPFSDILKEVLRDVL